MKQRGLVFDPNLCLGCHACQMACSVNLGLPAGIFLRKISGTEFLKSGQVIKFYLSSSCNHCENPECIRLCPEMAIRKRRDGVVLFDLDKCSGCGICIRGCPFQAPVMDPSSGKAIKCDMCYARLDDGQQPYCLEACPVGALNITDFFAILEEQEPTLVKIIPGVPKIQLTHPSIRYRPLRMGRQISRCTHKSREGEDR